MGWATIRISATSTVHCTSTVQRTVNETRLNKPWLYLCWAKTRIRSPWIEMSLGSSREAYKGRLLQRKRPKERLPEMLHCSKYCLLIWLVSLDISELVGTFSNFVGDLLELGYTEINIPNIYVLYVKLTTEN